MPGSIRRRRLFGAVDDRRKPPRSSPGPNDRQRSGAAAARVAAARSAIPHHLHLAAIRRRPRPDGLSVTAIAYETVTDANGACRSLPVTSRGVFLSGGRTAFQKPMAAGRASRGVPVVRRSRRHIGGGVVGTDAPVWRSAWREVTVIAVRCAAPRLDEMFPPRADALSTRDASRRSLCGRSVIGAVLVPAPPHEARHPRMLAGMRPVACCRRLIEKAAASSLAPTDHAAQPRRRRIPLLRRHMPGACRHLEHA